MPQSLKYDTNYFAMLKRRLDKLDREMYKLKGKSLTTAPDFIIADANGNAQDYQIAIDSVASVLKYHIGGIWHTAGGINLNVVNTGIYFDVELSAYAAIIADSIQFQSTGTGVIPDWSATGTTVEISATLDLILQGYNSLQLLRDVSGNQKIVMTAVGIAITSSADIGFDVGGILTTTFTAGALTRVVSSAAAPIFEVRDDGTIHGQAAIGAITWDL